jgi:hypothetical protein
MGLPLLAVAMGIGSAASGLSTLFGGFAQKRANKAQALGAQIERDMALLRGKQIGAESRQNLLTVEGNIDAIRSARGASLDSATGDAIRKRTRADAYRAEGAAVLGELTRAGAAEQARLGYKTSAKWAVPMAVLNSAGSFAQSYGNFKGAF